MDQSNEARFHRELKALGAPKAAQGKIMGAFRVSQVEMRPLSPIARERIVELWKEASRNRLADPIIMFARALEAEHGIGLS